MQKWLSTVSIAAILGNHKPPVSSTSAPPTSVFSTSGKVIRIDVLPDDVLLEIFDLCVDMNSGYDDKSDKTVIEGWQPLAHVCRRWRNIVLLSPHRLDLKLYCSPDTPAKDTLYIWPPLPLIIAGTLASSSHTNNVIAALGRNDCVIQVFLVLAGSQLEKVLAPMQVSFPGLTDLRLFSYDETPYTLPVIPDSFLGGSAPRLRTLELGSIPFPGLPILLLSATHLVSLSLYGIPHSGYISPQAIAAVLPVLSNLELLHLEFQSPQSRPDWESPSLPLSKRSILPVLTEFHFKGVTEYLEELMTYIDTPQLKQMNLHFFNQIDFDCPRLAQFINCTPTLKALDEAHVQFDDSTASVNLGSRTSKSRFDVLLIHISCREPDWQLSSIEQVCNWLLPLSTVVVLHIDHQHSKLVWKDDAIDDTLWLQLLLPFTAVEDLYLSNEFAPGIAAALQELVGNRITGVLPSLQNIFVKGLGLSGSFEEKIGQVVAARQFSEHPIAVSDWDEDSRLRLM